MTALETLACELVRLLAVITSHAGTVDSQRSLREAATRTWAAAIPAMSALDAHGSEALRSIRFGVVVARGHVITAMISCGAAMCRAARDSEPPITQRELDDGTPETP